MDGLLPEGQYEAVVKSAKEKVSKSGNPMIELILSCYSSTGAKYDVFDYLLSTDDWAWKVRHFCESAGIDWRGGDLDDFECVEKNVRVNLGIKRQPGYADKNNISDYLPRAGSGPKVTKVEDDDDSIPF